MSNTSCSDSLIQVCKNCTVSWIFNPRTVWYVEGYVLVAGALLLILLVLGPQRRRSHNWVVQYGVKGAYLLYFTLLSWTIGLMQGGVKNELYPVWATFTIFLFGGMNSVSVQKLDETKQWVKLWFDSIFYVHYLCSITSHFVYLEDKQLYSGIRYGATLILFFLVSLKNFQRVFALVIASDPQSSSSTINWYMKYFEPVLNTCHNPLTMQGYNYLVLPLRIHLPVRPRDVDIPALITLEKIWCHGNGVLSTDHPAIHQLKDMCLSFALFRLSLRRYFGHAWTESGTEKTRDLVFKGLLPTAEDCARAFRVIEVELTFLYDFFFTQYASITGSITGSFRWFVSTSLMRTIIIVALGIYCLTDLNNSTKYSGELWKLGLVYTKKQDIMVTKAILCALVTFQLVEFGLYLFSDWVKVYVVCNYITNSSWQNNAFVGKLLLLMGNVSLLLEKHKWFCSWENKIGQYTFMDAFDDHHQKSLETCIELARFVIPMFQIRLGRKVGKYVPVPMEVKKAVVRTLKDSNGEVSNGISALERHGMTTELYSACQTNSEFTLAQVILTWHIATSYCEISEVNVTESVHPSVQPRRIVATRLSKYCAYLVAFAPELVPGNPADTQDMLDELVFEARDVFKARSDMRQMFNHLQNEGTGDNTSILTKGAILGMKIERLMSQETRWELLSDFWAELMLYIAPSDNVASHIESLANGGEFVTHIWALLMHAGILERPGASAT